MSNIDQIEIQEENQETPEKTTYVALVVDESSSMGSMTEQAISLFNENLETMRLEGKSNNVRNVVSLVKFASGVEVIHENVELDQIEEIDNQTYRPGGMTAMYDGIGTAINILKRVPNYDDQEASFLVLVITDGEENHSREFSGNQLSEWITELEDKDKRWTFTVLGANVDLKKLRQTLGIKTANVQNFDFSHDGFNKGSRVMTRGLTAYYSARSEGFNRVDSFYDNDQGADLGNVNQSAIDNSNAADILNRLQGTRFTGNDPQIMSVDAETRTAAFEPDPEYSSSSFEPGDDD